MKWLEDYLKAQKNVTCLIISHDSGCVKSLLDSGSPPNYGADFWTISRPISYIMKQRKYVITRLDQEEIIQLSAACILPWKPVHLRREAPGGKIVLYPGRYHCQVFISTPRITHGCAKQHAGHLEIIKLYFYISRQDHTKSAQCQLRIVALKVRLS